MDSVAEVFRARLRMIKNYLRRRLRLEEFEAIEDYLLSSRLERAAELYATTLGQATSWIEKDTLSEYALQKVAKHWPIRPPALVTEALRGFEQEIGAAVEAAVVRKWVRAHLTRESYAALDQRELLRGLASWLDDGEEDSLKIRRVKVRPSQLVATFKGHQEAQETIRRPLIRFPNSKILRDLISLLTFPDRLTDLFPPTTFEWYRPGRRIVVALDDPEDAATLGRSGATADLMVLLAMAYRQGKQSQVVWTWGEHKELLSIGDSHAAARRRRATALFEVLAKIRVNRGALLAEPPRRSPEHHAIVMKLTDAALEDWSVPFCATWLRLPSAALRLLVSLSSDWMESSPPFTAEHPAPTLWEYAGVRDGASTTKNKKDATRVLERSLESLAQEIDLTWRLKADRYRIAPPIYWIDEANYGFPASRAPLTAPRTGQDLRAWRTRRGWSQRDLASRMASSDPSGKRWTQQQIHRLERQPYVQDEVRRLLQATESAPGNRVE